MNKSSNSKLNSGPARRGSNNKKSAKSSKPKVARKVRDQRVSAPVAKGRVATMSAPQTKNLANGDILVSHREYVQDINGSVLFGVNTIGINPGIAGSFPWLSSIARNYESYRFQSLSVHYETTAATTATGCVMLAIDYDSNDATPSSKAQAGAYRRSVRSPPWSDCSHISLREDLEKRKSYFVSAAFPAVGDANLDYTGFLYVCTVGQVDASAIGEIYFDYVVRFMTPQIGPIGIGQSMYGAFSGTTNVAPFATKTGNINATVSSSGTGTSVSTWIFSQPWEGYVTINLTGTGLTSPMFAGTGTATSAEISEVTPTAATSAIAVYRLSAQAGQTFILTMANTTISASSAYFGQADS
jgi:hypothetical protein